jgi:environmental stress-induced protein Ves
MNASVWSGGSSIQMFIYPTNATYTARDFEVRISSATIEIESSVFTDLPGYHRLLMPLNEPIRLVYQDHGEAMVNPLEIVEFEGGWHTTSYGVCTDLGIMLASGWQGEMETVGCGTYIGRPGFIGVYALIDKVNVDAKRNDRSLSNVLMQGDFLLLETQAVVELVLESSAKKAAVLIRVFRV